MRERSRLGTLTAAVVALSACAAPRAPLPAPPTHINGQALWRIVHDRCVPGERARHEPAPCALVFVAQGEARGYVVLKDRIGATQHLLMPTARITGIEDPALLRPEAVNYFARAWEMRRFAQARLPPGAPPAQMAVTVNSAYGRSQDQLHLHIDCLDRSVGRALRDAERPPAGGWAKRPISLHGHVYRMRWLNAGDLAAEGPIRMLAREVPGARQAMGAWTLALVGVEQADAPTSFILLADRADPAAGDRGSAEELQDHDCR